jgi:hypothetical protein
MDFFSDVYIALYVVVGCFLLICYLKIAKKAGYSYLFGFLLMVPIVNFVVLAIMAFETWPIMKTKAEIKAEKIARLKKELAELNNEGSTRTKTQEGIKNLNDISSKTLSKQVEYSADLLGCVNCIYFNGELYAKDLNWCRIAHESKVDKGVCFSFKAR